MKQNNEKQSDLPCGPVTPEVSLFHLILPDDQSYFSV